MKIKHKITLELRGPEIPSPTKVTPVSPDAENDTSLRAHPKRLREEFPFLASPDCPMELKALVTDRITSYHTFHDAYKELFTAGTPEECTDVARRIVHAYIDNRRMWAELEYYQKNKRVLGHHPIFRQFSNLRKIRSMSIKDLIRREERVKKNIWRVQNERNKNPRPDLEASRIDRIRGYQAELAEIQRLLGEDG